MQRQFDSTIPSLVLNLLRIFTGFLFMPHGAQKLFGMFGGVGGQPGATVPLFSLKGLAGILEFFGGLAILLGLFTRPVAFVLSGLMAVAYFMAHAPKGFWPLLNRGELAAIYAFVFLFLAAAGGGDLSIDGLLRKKKSGDEVAWRLGLPRPPCRAFFHLTSAFRFTCLLLSRAALPFPCVTTDAKVLPVPTGAVILR